MAVVPGRVTVTNAATRLDAAADSNNVPGQSVLVRNRDSATSVFLGGAGVTAAAGYELLAGEWTAVDLEPGDVLYGITAAGTALCHVLQTGA